MRPRVRAEVTSSLPLTPNVRPARLPADLPPLLLVVIDTEEEFDWTAPFDRDSRAVACIAEQCHAQELLEQYGVTPVYVMDYPVATTPDSAALFRDWATDARCMVGAHLHPWVNPPDKEEVSTRNSYPGNLPPDLEREKLGILSQAIAENIGRRPTIYKAGRYGLGPHTAETLKALDYEIDLSVVPATSFTADGGPNYIGYPHHPYWFGPDQGLFEIPLTRGYPGPLGDWGEPVHRAAAGPMGVALRLPGILARLRLVERILLTPEGVSAAENLRLVRHLLGRGRRVFTYAYHSSSLLPGGSPYTRTPADRQHFLDEMRRFLDGFMGELGGQGTTPTDLRDMARRGG